MQHVLLHCKHSNIALGFAIFVKWSRIETLVQLNCFLYSSRWDLFDLKSEITELEN